MATTAPKYFETLRASRSGGASAAAGAVCRLHLVLLAQRRPAKRRRIQLFRTTATSRSVPSATRYQSALMFANTIPIWAMPEGQRADGRPRDRPVAAGQKAAADDGGGDGPQLVALAAEHVRREEGHALDGGQDGRREGGPGEQRDLDPIDRDAQVARGARRAADAGDPVAELGPAEDVDPDGREQDPPQDRDLEVADAPVEEPGDRIGRDDFRGDRDVGDLRDLRGQRLGRAADDEQRRQGDDERRQPGPDDDATRS